MSRLSRTIIGAAVMTAALTVPALTTAAAGEDDHVVASGDTLVDIAAEHGVSLRALLAANGLRTTSLIVPGQRLVVPDSPPQPGPAYTVAAGDTLIGIAASAGASLSDVLAVNGLSATSLITPGMEIRLPAGASAPSATAPAAAVTPTGSRVDRVLAYALAQVGKPYVFFTKGPAVFDCSGLTLAAYAQIGVDLVHHSATQAVQGRSVDFWNGSIRAGDLVFLDGDWNGEIDHVGIALGPTTWVHASQTQNVVTTGPLPSKSVIISVRRFVDG